MPRITLVAPEVAPELVQRAARGTLNLVDPRIRPVAIWTVRAS